MRQNANAIKRTSLAEEGQMITARTKEHEGEEHTAKDGGKRRKEGSSAKKREIW